MRKAQLEAELSRSNEKLGSFFLLIREMKMRCPDNSVAHYFYRKFKEEFPNQVPKEYRNE